MDCGKIQEQLLDVATGGQVSPAVEAHVRACPACAKQADALRSTMAMLDEWQAPEPSPYFDTRLQARIREIQAEEAVPAGWFERLRRPVLALAMVGLMAIGISLYQGGSEPVPDIAKQPVPAQNVEVSAVTDLQSLESDLELYAEFDLLDAIAAEGPVDQ